MKKIRNNHETEAASPVIGVMLMLVVTIIIAAVVSGLAGDIGLDKKTGPNVVLSEPVLDFDSNVIRGDLIKITWIATPYGNPSMEMPLSPPQEVFLPPTVNDQHGLTFTHLGGDPIDLKDLQMSFNSNDMGIVVDYDSVRSQISAGAFEPQYEIGDDFNSAGNISKCELSYYNNPGRDVEYTLDELVELSNSQHYGYFAKVSPETDDDTIIRTGDQFKIYTDDGGQPWAIAATNDAGITQSFAFEFGSGNNWILSHKPSGEILGQGDLVFPDNSIIETE
ncbi:type IV pilin N-terminal domain-containing protein [Methanolacinia paynteri]|uniref:type IV pilin N-terminal domain-containing protein n=1 Tax=Methanolacinia paynteri TaxID=230356 RepID=UPI00064F049B|nr:type IV pilin N-terminal domain-containing protein [Methanolacinia paynteri]